MLEVQLCTRSRGGVVVPIARDESPELVRLVIRHIFRKMARWQFSDEVLDRMARMERDAFIRLVAAEGFSVREGGGDEDKKHGL